MVNHVNLLRHRLSSIFLFFLHRYHFRTFLQSQSPFRSVLRYGGVMHYSTLFNMAENQHFLIISDFLATISKAFSISLFQQIGLGHIFYCLGYLCVKLESGKKQLEIEKNKEGWIFLSNRKDSVQVLVDFFVHSSDV